MLAGDDSEFVMMRTQRFKSVWDAIEPTPEGAAVMKVRSALMIAIEEAASHWNVTPAQVAKRLHISQPRLNDLLRGKINKFNLDALVEVATHAGLKVSVKITKQAA